MRGATSCGDGQIIQRGIIRRSTLPTEELASLLNEIWVQPVGPNDVPRAEKSAPGQVFSSKTVTGQIVGNRRSKIYAWPGCGSYDTMAPQNRVVFSSRPAAEQAGCRGEQH